MLRKLISSSNPKILILEDDDEQMALLIDFALSEIKHLMHDEGITEKQKKKIESIQIIKVTNKKSLQKAASTNKGVILAVLDCNTPDDRGSASHDQLVTTGGVITGQHNSVDIVTKHLPATPITLISSLDRFQRTVNKYYAAEHDLSINFVRKSDPSGIKETIRSSLKDILSDVS